MKPTAPPKKVRVAIYTRVSTSEQADEGVSMASQLDRCRRLIALREADGWVEADVYADPACTGGNLDRPSLKEMLSDAEAGLIDVIAIYKFDRLTRKLTDFHSIWGRLQQLNVNLVAATQDINTETSTGRLMLNMLMSFAEFERELIKERSQMGMEYAFSAGDIARSMGGRSSFGYEYDKNKKIFVIVEDEAKWVREVFKLYVEGSNPSQIATRLNELGVKTRVRTEKSRTTGERVTGGNDFNQDSIRRMLRNPIYLGRLEYKGVIKEGEHDPILSREYREKWDEIRLKLSPEKADGKVVSKLEVKIKEKNKWGLFFKGVLFDAESGQALTPAPSGKARKGQAEPHLYYEPNKDRKVVGKNKVRFPARAIERVAFLVFENLAQDPTLVDTILQVDSQHVVRRIAELESVLRRTDRELADNEGHLKVCLETRGTAKKETFGSMQKFADEYEERVSALKKRRGEIGDELKSLRANLLSEQSIKTGLANFHQTFAALPTENKVNLCKLFFKRIDIRYLPQDKVNSKSGGHVHSDGTVVFPVKRTKWVEMKFAVNASLDYQRLFDDQAKVRICEKLASTSGEFRNRLQPIRSVANSVKLTT